MSFKSTAKIGDTEFTDVKHCVYELYREVDPKGRPSSVIFGGTIEITVESTKDTSIIEAMVNDEHKPLKDGSIVFKEGNEDKEMKKLSFENGYIIRFKEDFDNVNSKAMSATFTISAETIKIGGATHKNDWPKK